MREDRTKQTMCIQSLFWNVLELLFNTINWTLFNLAPTLNDRPYTSSIYKQTINISIPIFMGRNDYKKLAMKTVKRNSSIPFLQVGSQSLTCSLNSLLAPRVGVWLKKIARYLTCDKYYNLLAPRLIKPNQISINNN